MRYSKIIILGFFVDGVCGTGKNSVRKLHQLTPGTEDMTVTVVYEGLIVSTMRDRMEEISISKIITSIMKYTNL